ncbi:hypothetical protein llap_5042 [Limosa lapponica baueri]|uniref:Uncharacterized protein n=1 Tax=Limosa lapponica baueri TaxID=1758121 RepID=A0A2I0UF53_LIMLA|nr:hypothetical protein llap_5042 [Limosa lapponica baueri]
MKDSRRGILGEYRRESTHNGECSQKRTSGVTGFLFLENKCKEANAAIRKGKPQEQNETLFNSKSNLDVIITVERISTGWLGREPRKVSSHKQRKHQDGTQQFYALAKRNGMGHDPFNSSMDYRIYGVSTESVNFMRILRIVLAEKTPQCLSGHIPKVRSQCTSPLAYRLIIILRVSFDSTETSKQQTCLAGCRSNPASPDANNKTPIDFNMSRKYAVCYLPQPPQ